jgi:hypothetical protein
MWDYPPMRHHPAAILFIVDKSLLSEDKKHTLFQLEDATVESRLYCVNEQNLTFYESDQEFEYGDDWQITLDIVYVFYYVPFLKYLRNGLNWPGQPVRPFIT